MLTINIIALGKLKEQYLKDAICEYSKRLSPYCKFNIIEIAEKKLSNNPSQKEIENALAEEGKVILKYADVKSAYNISMCIEGKQLSSKELAENFNAIAISGKSIINFIIGSSFGLSEDVKINSDFKLSMSKMTFPHQLARVMLSEQIYRAFQILNNSKYHK